MYSLTVNLPYAGLETPVLVDHLGEFVNGTTNEITDEQVAMFETATGQKFLSAMKRSHGLSAKYVKDGS